MRAIPRLVIAGVLLSTGLVVAAPDATATAAAPRARACAIPSGVTVTSDLYYVNDGNVAHTLDVYRPSTGSGYPAVQVVHGGGWHAGKKEEVCDESVYLARNGFVAFAINYRLTTATHPSWQESYPDTEAAAEWIVAHASQYGANAAKFASFGMSAGGNLSALLDTTGPTRPKTTVAWSGPMDLTAQGYSEAAQQQKDVERAYLGCTPGSCSQGQDVSMSPLKQVSSNDTSLLNFNSTDEIISLASAQRMDAALAGAGVPHKLVVLNGDLHAAFYECTFVNVGGVNAEVIDQTVRWLGLKLNGQVTAPTGDYPSSACKTH